MVKLYRWKIVWLPLLLMVAALYLWPGGYIGAAESVKLNALDRMSENFSKVTYVDDDDWATTDCHLLIGGLYGSNTITSGHVGPIQVDASGNIIITMAATDSHWGAVGAAADVDGVAHGQLRFIGEAVDTVETVLGTIDTDTGNIATSVSAIPAKGTAAMAASLPVTIATDDTVLTKLTSSPVEKTPVKVTQFVAVASTAEALVASETFARVLHLQAKRATADNATNVFVGLSDLDQGVAELFELSPGDTLDLDMPAGTKIDLNDLYIDADTATDGVVGWYIPI